MELLEVRTGSKDDFANGQTTNYAPTDLTLIDTPAGSLRLRLDEKIDRGTELVQVRFRATIFGNSASFRALVQNSAIPGFWQRVDEGDPTELVSSQTVTVLLCTRVGRNLLKISVWSRGYSRPMGTRQ